MRPTPPSRTFILSLIAALLTACGGSESDQETTAVLHNDFANPAFDRQPPWTLCETYYGGTEFGRIAIGEQSQQMPVSPGLGYVLMVASWDDPACNKAHALPLASRQEEEVVPGQSRTIAINLPNHQGPCPPEGVQPMPQDLYDAIRARWPEYGFLPYEQRTENAQCSE